MDRRSLLATVGLASTGLAGCLGIENVIQSEDVRAGYEACGTRIVAYGQLPLPARDEVRSAIANGTYETNGRLLLWELVDHADRTYLRHEGDYYAIGFEKDGGRRRVELTAAVPTVDTSTVVLNRTSETVTLAVTITRAGEPFLSKTVTIGAKQEYAPIATGHEFPYGRYRTEVDVEGLSERTFDWKVSYSHRPPDVEVFEDRVTFEPRIVHGRSPCTWNDTGEIVFRP